MLHSHEEYFTLPYYPCNRKQLQFNNCLPHLCICEVAGSSLNKVSLLFCCLLFHDKSQTFSAGISTIFLRCLSHQRRLTPVLLLTTPLLSFIRAWSCFFIHVNSFLVLRGGLNDVISSAIVFVLDVSWLTNPTGEHSSVCVVGLENYVIAAVMEGST